MEHHILTWAVIDQTADKLGVSGAARKKWRSRRVPYEWRLKIAEELRSAGIIVPLAQFDAVEPARARAA